MASQMAPLSLDRVEAPMTTKAYFMCAFAAVAGLLFGYDSGYISSVLGMDEFRRTYGRLVPLATDSHAVPDPNQPGYGYDYATWEKSLIVPILSAGTFFGALLSGALADWMGRRSTIIAGCFVFVAGVALQVSVLSLVGIVTGRLIAGFGVGFVSAVTVLYMSECAPKRIRGALVSGYQFAITIGLMLASCVCYATQDRTDSSAFRIPIAMQFVFAVVLAIGLFMLPESPRYHVRKQQFFQAARALSRLRGQYPESDFIQDELAEIQANYEYELQIGEETWLGCFSGGLKRSSNLRKILLGTLLQFFQQASGINFIFYYNTTFFQQVGLSDPFLISMMTTFVNVCSTPFAFVTIEKFGRRPLLIWGAIGMTICEFIVAIVGTLQPGSRAANYCLIVFVCLYIFSFASTWGPAGWVLVGEIYQLPIRSKGVSMSTAANWLWNCVFAVIVPYIVDAEYGNLGAKVFFIWGSTCAACIAFAYFLVPETKGLTLEQVDQMMEQVSPRQSSRWTPSETFVQTMGYGNVRDVLNNSARRRRVTASSWVSTPLVNMPRSWLMDRRGALELLR